MYVAAAHCYAQAILEQAQNSYQSLAKNLLQFRKVNSIPMNINLQLARLDDGEGIAETLVQHRTLYHKSCYLKFASDKLKRAHKRALNSPAQKKSRTVLILQHQKQNAFFSVITCSWVVRCTKSAPSRVRECATRLYDTALLTKLIVSDMHALDAKYHRNCLIGLCNHMCSHLSNNKSDTLHTNPISVEAVALAELMSYMKDSAQDDNMVKL